MAGHKSHVFHLSRVRLKFLYLQWEQHPPCWCSLHVDPCQWKGPVCFRLSLSVNWSEVTEALAQEQAQEGRLWNQLLSILTYPKYLDMLLCMTLVRIPAIKVLKVYKKKYNYINIHSSFPSPWDLSCGRVDHQRIHIHVVACKEESKNSFLYMPHKEISFSLYSFILFLFPAFTPQAIPWSTYIEQKLKWLINMLTLKKRHTLWGSAWKEIETMCYGN